MGRSKISGMGLRAEGGWGRYVNSKSLDENIG
jgi:hypothetical protein